MQKITPHLWYDKEAKEAAEFYVALFPNSKITNVTTLHDTPSGNADVVSFELSGQKFMAISAGPLFKFNPSVSFLVYCKTEKEVEDLWNKLSAGGKVLMALDKYPFSEKYGWLEDKYELSWQIIISTGDIEQKIIPSLMFTKNTGKAEEAINFYTSVFSQRDGSPDNSKPGNFFRYEEGQAPDKDSKIAYADFILAGQKFAAMDGGQMHNFSFNEAISLMVNCEDQKEIDYYWEKLSVVPEAEQCGWCKDKYGVSWQITPTILDEMMRKGTPEQVDRLTQAFLPMKKFNIDELEKAYNGN